MAYGADISETLGNVGNRATAQGYNKPDEIRKQYTGYEHDDESGLDFAQARYYNASHGRFTSIDPLTASANVKDPQTFNRYTYALNSPYKFTDPLGLISSSTNACGQWCSNAPAFSAGPAADDFSWTVHKLTERGQLSPLLATPPPTPSAEQNQDKPELKYEFNFKGQTYTYTPKTVYVKSGNPWDGGPLSEPQTKESEQRDFVFTSKEVNFALSKFQSAVYANELIAASQTNALKEAKDGVSLKEIELGISADFGLKADKAVSISPSISAKFQVNNAQDIDASRRNADNLIQTSTRNELRGLKTLATGSGDTPRNLTENEISGLINAARTKAVEAARKDIATAAELRRTSGN